MGAGSQPGEWQSEVKSLMKGFGTAFTIISSVYLLGARLSPQAKQAWQLPSTPRSGG